MEEKLFLRNDLSSIVFRISMLIFGVSAFLFGLLGTQNYKWFHFLNSMGWILVFIISLPRYSYIMLNNSHFIYKKSFFHKVIYIENNSISGMDFFFFFLVINANNIRYKIAVGNVREYIYKNSLPEVIQELKNITDKNKMLVN